ncbi:hypothetical protein [Paracoccus sanguinis]|uniref:hypothetical protein n=1 Tax=Paracoccus sanguinis TaxID=1545044 RepID=UPI001E6484DC|nr:hypothetical protein [Paracoccus sanguinis]
MGISAKKSSVVLKAAWTGGAEALGSPAGVIPLRAMMDTAQRTALLPRLELWQERPW